MERLEGRVVGEDVEVSYAQLEVAGETKRKGSGSGTFRLVIDDGSEVEVCHEHPRLGPLEEHRDSWGDLVDDPLAGPFEDEAPGHHVKVRLAGVVVRGGDRVVVEGEIERKPETEGYRGGEGAVIRSVKAHRIGVGDGAEAWLDQEAERIREAREEREEREAEAAQKERERAKKKTKRADDYAPLPLTWTYIGLGLGGAAVVAALVAKYAGLGFHISRLIALGLGLQLFTTSLYKLRKRRPLPKMVLFGSHEEGRGIEWTPTLGRLVLGCGWALTLMLVMGVATEAAPYALFALLVVAVSALLLGLTLGIARRKDARALRILLRGKPAEGEGWGLRVGTLKRGRLRRGRSHQSRSSTRTQNYTDSDGRAQTRQVTDHWWEYTGAVGGTDLEIEVEGGEMVSVHTEQAIWGTTRHEVKKASTWLMQQKTELGDSVAVLGRVKDGKVRATGPESLFIFTAPEGLALKAARRALAAHRLTLAAFGAIAVAAATLGWSNIAQDERHREAEVIASTHPRVQIGSTCTFDLGYTPAWGHSTLPDHCQGVVTCGDTVLFGGWSFLGKGFFDCDAAQLLSGDVGSAENGQGRVRFRFR